MTSQPSVAPRSGVTRSLVGQKAVMAVTGVILFLFVVAHLLGNLKIFEGPAAFDAYAEGLRTVGAPFFGRGWLLWIARVVLIVAVLTSCLVAPPSRTADRGHRRCVLAEVDAAADRYVIGVRVAAARELRRVVADDAVLDRERSRAPDPAPARLDAVRWGARRTV